MMNAAFDDWTAEAKARDIGTVAHARYKVDLRRAKAGVPCPGCGGRDRFSLNARKKIFWCRASQQGGDVINLLRHCEGFDFVGACEALTGRPPPGRDASETPEARERREERLAREARARHEAEAALLKEEEAYRERERERMHGVWLAARPIAGTPASAYLAARGIPVLPAGACLRFIADHPLWDAATKTVLHRGPAMAAAIEGPTGRFAGLHATWFDPDRPGEKIMALDRAGVLTPAKKVRGSQKGGSIRLASCVHPARLVIGEGIETVLSVWTALSAVAAPMLEDTAFRSAVSLGNLSGRAADSVVHPFLTQTDAAGRVRKLKVPGGAPADEADNWPLPRLPATLRELILLGDGDSDAFTTGLALDRAAKRFARARPDLTVRVAMATPGCDFNDMLRASRPAMPPPSHSPDTRISA